jgi:hypothetical protein
MSSTARENLKAFFLCKNIFMAVGKKNVIVYTDWISTFELLSDEEAGKLIKHFFRYVNDQDPQPPDRLIEILFEPIKTTLKRDLNKWEVRAERARENGLRGGRPKTENNPEEPTRLFLDEKKPVSVSVSVSDSVSVKENNSLTTILTDSSIVQKFDFKKSLLSLNVPENIVNDWIKVRKNKKATNTETAFKKIANEIAKAKITPSEAIQLCVERSWSGFQSDWYLNDKQQKHKNYDDNFKRDDGSIDHDAKRQAFVDRVLGRDPSKDENQKSSNFEDIGFVDVTGK